MYRTATAYDEINPWWEPKQLNMTAFCNNNKQLPLRISVMHYTNSGPDKMYGYCDISTRGIEMLELGAPIEIKNAKGQIAGKIAFNQF